MLSGLLMELDDHNCWTIAEAVGHCGPHRLQHLPSPPSLKCLCRDNAVITTNYKCRN
jgi:hypothetical protein